MMFFSSMGPRWTPRHLLDQFWEGLGRIWGGFGEGLGRNFEGFGRFCVGFGQILDAFGKMWPCCGKAYKLDPRADPRSVTIKFFELWGSLLESHFSHHILHGFCHNFLSIFGSPDLEK